MPWFRSATPHDPLAVTMTGVKLGDRLLVIGCGQAKLVAQLALKPGLTGRACALDERRRHVGARRRCRLAGRRAARIRNGTVHKPPPQRLSLRHRRSQPHPGRRSRGNDEWPYWPKRGACCAMGAGASQSSHRAAVCWHRSSAAPLPTRGTSRARWQPPAFERSGRSRNAKEWRSSKAPDEDSRPPVLSGRQLSQGAYTPAVPRLTDFREKGRKTMRGLQRRRSNPRQVFCPWGQAGQGRNLPIQAG